MPRTTTSRSNGKTKKERLAEEIAKAVGAGRPVSVEAVDFNDPNRPKTCLEVDFPIIPINQISQIEGNAGKPIYQMSKWWARRRSSVFRAMLLAGAMKAPEDSAKAARAVWDVYYANHEKQGALRRLRVADIFMGGGTTLVEGSRLGMNMLGNDLNPVAWFVVKQELADVDIDEVNRLLVDIENEVRPQIIPYYYCDGPNGEKGTWTHLPSGRIEPPDFDPLALSPNERREYQYRGPEIIYSFWAKHGPCSRTGCGHRTPIMTTAIAAIKTLSVKSWDHTCGQCGGEFDIESAPARMAPDVPLYVAPGERPFAVLDPRRGVTCPCCGHTKLVKMGKAKSKKITLSLLVRPQWLIGCSGLDPEGRAFGGAAQDDADSTVRWNRERAKQAGMIEVRGNLPAKVTCPETGVEFFTDERGGNGGLTDKKDKTGQTLLDQEGLPLKTAKKSAFACASCGAVQDILASVTANAMRAPMSLYAVQGYSPRLANSGAPYGGRFFAPANDSRQVDAATREWAHRKDADLAPFWPRTSLPEGFKTTYQRIPEHGYALFADMFNPRQMLVMTQLLRAILNVSPGRHTDAAREFVLAAFQQYLRNQNMFCLWNIQADKLEPHFSNNNYYPKNTPVENCVFGPLGRGNWTSCAEGLIESLHWKDAPWELVSNEYLSQSFPQLKDLTSGKSEKISPQDRLVGPVQLTCGSSTDLSSIQASSVDLVITDPPFGNNVQYSELADFFHVWLKIALQEKYPQLAEDLTPKVLEVVDNPVRNPDAPQDYYQKLLTGVWRESARILKRSGLLAFTFHHSEDGPWVSVLESLFEAGFYLEATYPIRSDETKGEGSKPGTFGSQMIEYDIIHVCRKRTEAPTPVSWARMRREVLREVRQIAGILELHLKAGLPAGDLQVIKRGKALEYFSRHYGKVYVDEDKEFTVRDALIGINQLLDEESGTGKEPPPVNAEPFTRQFLRLFDGVTQQPRDQMQKLLRGTTIDPKEYEERGWCKETQKVYHLVSPLDIAQEWYGKHRRRLTSDYDQAMVLIGASFPNSGINVTDTLNNPNFRPHAALGRLLKWHISHAASQRVRDAALIASQLFATWESQHREERQQLNLFFDDGEEA